MKEGLPLLADELAEVVFRDLWTRKIWRGINCPPTLREFRKGYKRMQREVYGKEEG